jgi:hypothetical protein
LLLAQTQIIGLGERKANKRSLSPRALYLLQHTVFLQANTKYNAEIYEGVELLSEYGCFTHWVSQNFVLLQAQTVKIFHAIQI